MPYPHGFATNGGLSSGGGAHEASSDIFTTPLSPAPYAPSDDSRSRDDDGYSQDESADSDNDDAGTAGPSSRMSDDSPYPKIMYSTSPEASSNDSGKEMPIYKGHINAFGQPQTELNEPRVRTDMEGGDAAGGYSDERDTLSI